MRSKNIDPADIRYRWAKSILTGQESCQELAGQNSTPVSIWYGKIDDRGFSVSSTDWVAYQVLRGDESTWQSVSRMADRNVLSSMGEQVLAFNQSFFSLTRDEKQQHFELLERQTIDNSFVKQVLERYRPFLDMDKLESLNETLEVLELIREVVGQCINGPVGRKESVQKMLGRFALDPKRWSAAAKDLQNRQPRFAQLQPLLIDQILHGKRETPSNLAQRKAFQRRYAFRLFKCRIADQLNANVNPIHFISGGFALFFVIAIVGQISRPSVERLPPETYRPTLPRANYSSPNSNNNDRNPPTAMTNVLRQILQEREEKMRRFDSLQPTTKQAVNLIPTAEEGTLLKKSKREWAKIARTEGTDGLNAIEEKFDLESKSDQPRQLTYGLRLFRYWRSDEGDAIARKTDEMKRNHEAVEGEDKMPSGKMPSDKKSADKETTDKKTTEGRSESNE